jgi:hypothetical protein
MGTVKEAKVVKPMVTVALRTGKPRAEAHDQKLNNLLEVKKLCDRGVLSLSEILDLFTTVDHTRSLIGQEALKAILRSIERQLGERTRA